MKKLLGIVVLGLLLSGNAYAKKEEQEELNKCIKIDEYRDVIINHGGSLEYPYVEFAWTISYSNSCDKDIYGTPTYFLLDRDGHDVDPHFDTETNHPIFYSALIPAKSSYEAKGIYLLSGKKKIETMHVNSAGIKNLGSFVNGLTQEEAINYYLSDKEFDRNYFGRLDYVAPMNQEHASAILLDKELDPIEGIWISVSGNEIYFDGENDRIFLIYKKDDKFICKTIRSTKLSSGEDFCNLTKGSTSLYYENESNLTFNLTNTFNKISSNQCVTPESSPCPSYVRIWPDVF